MNRRHTRILTTCAQSLATLFQPASLRFRVQNLKFMKLHRHLCASTLELAKSVLVNHRVLDHELAAAFEANPKWGKRDRSFVAETLFETTRWRRVLSFLVDSEETNSLITAQWLLMGYTLPDWHEYNGLPAEEILARQSLIADQPRAIRQSIPDWLDELGHSELGDQWEPQLAALNEKPSVFLRVNTLLCHRRRSPGMARRAQRRNHHPPRPPPRPRPPSGKNSPEIPPPRRPDRDPGSLLPDHLPAPRSPARPTHYRRLLRCRRQSPPPRRPLRKRSPHLRHGRR